MEDKEEWLTLQTIDVNHSWKDEAEKHGFRMDDLAFNNGILISKDGNAFKIRESRRSVNQLYAPTMVDIQYAKIQLDYSKNYPIVPNEYLTKKVQNMSGQYLHRMVVYSWGDCNGKLFKEYPNFDIDHIDMNHSNAAVKNLQLVSHGINLFRAYRKCGGSIDEQNSCCFRFKSYYNSLDDLDRKILDKEIELDLEGKLQ